MNTISIATHINYDTASSIKRRGERMAEEVIQQARVDSLRDTLIDVIRMDRELGEKVAEAAPIAERLTRDFHEMFPDSGDAA